MESTRGNKDFQSYAEDNKDFPHRVSYSHVNMLRSQDQCNYSLCNLQDSPAARTGGCMKATPFPYSYCDASSQSPVLPCPGVAYFLLQHERMSLRQLDYSSQQKLRGLCQSA